MAGSDRSGVENAKSSIFNKAVVIITKTKDTHKEPFATLARFWKGLA